MFKKLFGSLDDSQSRPTPDRAVLERTLAEIALAAPAEWVALVKSNGLSLASFPSKLKIDDDRVSAMSAAMASLGERIATELGNGALQYTLIAGADEVTIMIALNPQYLLSLALKRDVSIETTLRHLQEIELPALMRVLYLNGAFQFSGVSQS